MKIIEQQPNIRERFCAEPRVCPLCQSTFQAAMEDCTVIVQRTKVVVMCPACHEQVTFMWLDRFIGCSLL